MSVINMVENIKKIHPSIIIFYEIGTFYYICRKKLPQFTTMNVIDGQAGLVNYSSLIFYSLTIDNILNIIVLLILAGVTIATLTGDNGILTKASEASEQTQIGEEKEAIGIAYNGVMADTEGNGVNATDLQTELRNNGYNATVTDNGDGTLTVTFESGNAYTVDRKGNITGPTNGEVTSPTTGKTDGSYDASKGVNTPKIDEEEGMQLVKYDEGTQTWVEDTTKSEYSYEEQTGTTENGGKSKWANAKVIINGVESYFVWIPRYAYKIDSNNHVIDVKFIKDTGTEATDGTPCKYADDSSLNTSTDYIIHPAFTTNADLGGGWSTELSGLWIGKYETARSDSEGATQGTSTTIKIQPNVTSWRGTTIGGMYTYALNYSTAYTGTKASSAYKYGDATHETSSWNSDAAYFVSSMYPFFGRGGHCNSASDAGVFSSYNGDGDSEGNLSFRSFRVSLAVQ